MAQTLAALVWKRANLEKRPPSMSLGVPGYGAFFFSTDATSGIREAWSDDADLLMIISAETLSDLVDGRFDPRAPRPGHLLWWAGEPEDLRALAETLEGAAPGFASQLSVRGWSDR